MNSFNLVVFGEIWLVAENTASCVKVGKCRTTFVDKYFGIGDLAKDVENGTFPIKQVRVLITMIGRAEAVSKDRSLLGETLRLITAVRARKEAVTMILCGPWPRARDDARRVRKIHALGLQLKGLVQQSMRVHYCSVSEEFTTPHGVNLELITQEGFTEKGSRMVRSRLLSMLEDLDLLDDPKDLQVTVQDR